MAGIPSTGVGGECGSSALNNPGPKRGGTMGSGADSRRSRVPASTPTAAPASVSPPPTSIERKVTSIGATLKKKKRFSHHFSRTLRFSATSLGPERHFSSGILSGYGGGATEAGSALRF